MSVVIDEIDVTEVEPPPPTPPPAPERRPALDPQAVRALIRRDAERARRLWAD